MQENEQRKYELGHEKVSTLLTKYSTPAIIAMLVNSLYNLVDTIFIGQGAGTMAIAGLTIAFPIQMIIMAVAQTVGIGAASIVSRSLGAGNHRKAEQVAGSAFSTVSILSVFMTIFGLLFLTPLLRIFGATDTILPYSVEYMTVILLGTFFFSYAITANSLVRSEGNAKVAMISMIIGTGLNIILDPIFIFTFKMGIRGAALATVLAQVISFLYLVRYFTSGKSMLKIHLKDFKPDLELVLEIFSIGSASFARTVASSAFSIILNHSIIRYGTDLHIAIFGVANRMLMFMLMPLFGIIQGLQPILGFNYGAKKIGRVKESLRLATIVATVFSTFSFIVLLFFTTPLVRLFNNDTRLINEGVPLIRIIIVFLPIIGFQIVGASLFQAIGKAGPALILSMSRQILFLIPLLLVLPLFFGLVGIFYAFPISDLLSAVVTGFWLLREVRIMNEHAEGKLAEVS